MPMLCTLFVVYLFSLHGFTKEYPKSSPFRKNTSTKANEVVAFTAELSATTDILGDSTIVFDTVRINAGGRYYGTSGQFVCTDDRVYVFIWSLTKGYFPGSEGEGMRCTSKLRNAAIDQKFGPKTSYYSMYETGVAQMTAVHQCTSSSAVTVMTVPWSHDVGSLSRFLASYTSFSGFRLVYNIAFTAEISQDEYLFPGNRIPFDRVLSNYGGHYNQFDHVFRCPDDGVYVFSVNTYTRDPATPWSVSRLMRDGVIVLQGPITYRATADYDSGSASTTAVLQCVQDSSVYVEAQAAHDFSYNSYGSELTSFTGFKLYNSTEGGVAFTVVMSSNHTTVYDAQPLFFHRIVTNIGNAFDPDRSEFVCPDNDYYLFTFTMAADYGGSYSAIDLQRDGVPYKYLILNYQPAGDANGTSGSSSICIIQQCSVGARFNIAGRHAQDRVYLGGFCSFSGYKIPS